MRENLLLNALPNDERERLDPFLERVEMPLHEVLIEPEAPIDHVYFPIDAVTSTITMYSDGTVVETGMMGVEGCVGIQLWLRAAMTATRTVIQVGGSGHRMSADNFVREVIDQPESPLNTLLARYVHAFLNMTSVTAACNRIHEIEERLCRWLKMVHNRVGRDEFYITQDFLAQMLAVSRPTVSLAAGILKSAGLIRYSRGNMAVLDPEGLADGACECLEIIETQVDSIFQTPWRVLPDDRSASGAVMSEAV